MSDHTSTVYRGQAAIRFVEQHGGWLRYADKDARGGGRIVTVAEAKKLARWHPKRITGGARVVKQAAESPEPVKAAQGEPDNVEPKT